MTEYIVVVNFPESSWGTDIVKFAFDHKVKASDIEDELNFAMRDLYDNDFNSAQDYANAVCKAAADALHGTWEFVAQACEINICY